jgi:hypothetical protein
MSESSGTPGEKPRSGFSAPPGVLRVGIVPALRSHSVNEGLRRVVPRQSQHGRRLGVHDLTAT